MTIRIEQETDTPQETAASLRQIADKIEQGYTSGKFPDWEIVEEE